MSAVSNAPRIVVGTAKTMLYEFQSIKPVHGAVPWAEGIWSQAGAHFQPCRQRRCLLLLSIDPVTKRHKYQHGGGSGAATEIQPDQEGYAQLSAWLDSLHQAEDAAAAGSQPAAATSSDEPSRRGGLRHLLAGLLGSR